MHCWARYLFIGIISILGIGQMIAACGQKGDLYLPEPEAVDAKVEPRGAEVPAPTPPPVTEAAE